MREIKFRAWDTILKYMLMAPENKWTLSRFWESIQEREGFELMQYTGLTDRNGKEIYEGDILSVQGGNEHQGYREFNETGYVEFASGSFMFAYHSHGNKVYADFGHFDKEDTEVIGNRCEHPELLEG